MKKVLFGLLILFATAACVEKPAPGPDVPDVPDNPQKDTTETPEPKPDKPDISNYTLHSAFDDTFAGASNVFGFATRASGDDFRYFTGFPSWNERGTNLLVLRVDPAEPAGIQDCIKVLTRDYTYYGSYSIRLRLPDIKAVQPNNGIKVALTCAEQDEKYGYSTIEMMCKMADPSYVYTNTIAGVDRSSAFVHDPVDGFKPSGAYYTYGFDWTADKVAWWIMVGSEKKVIREATDAVPDFPSRFGVIIYHSKNNCVEGNPNAVEPPFYPYEFEIDWIKYEPF